MRKLLLLSIVSLLATPVEAQDWSFGASSGAFVFGHFVERTTRISTEEGSATQTVTLSAATRPGLSLDIERRLAERFAIRLEGAFTRSPLGIKGTSRQDPTVTIPAGEIDVMTLMLPLIMRINPHGTFRLHVMAGPAAASYRITTRENAAQTIPIFRGTRTKWGVALGGGAAWQWSEYFAVEANITDINTESPFRREEIGGLGAIKIPRSNHLHTTIGIRYRF